MEVSKTSSLSQTITQGIIISIFEEDNIFSMNAYLPYCPLLNTDIDSFEAFC